MGGLAGCCGAGALCLCGSRSQSRRSRFFYPSHAGTDSDRWLFGASACLLAGRRARSGCSDAGPSASLLVLGAAGWIVLVPMWLALVHLQAHPWVLLLVLSIVWIADTAAYLAGRRWAATSSRRASAPARRGRASPARPLAVGVYYAVLWFAAPAGWDGWRARFRRARLRWRLRAEHRRRPVRVLDEAPGRCEGQRTTAARAMAASSTASTV